MPRNGPRIDPRILRFRPVWPTRTPPMLRSVSPTTKPPSGKLILLNESSTKRSAFCFSTTARAAALPPWLGATVPNMSVSCDVPARAHASPLSSMQ